MAQGIIAERERCVLTTLQCILTIIHRLNVHKHTHITFSYLDSEHIYSKSVIFLIQLKTIFFPDSSINSGFHFFLFQFNNQFKTSFVPLVNQILNNFVNNVCLKSVKYIFLFQISLLLSTWTSFSSFHESLCSKIKKKTQDETGR